MVLNINLLQLTTLYVINYVKNYLKYYNISMVLNINLFQYRANLSNTRSSCHITLGSKAKTEKKKWIQLIFYYKNQKFSIFPMLVSGRNSFSFWIKLDIKRRKLTEAKTRSFGLKKENGRKRETHGQSNHGCNFDHRGKLIKWAIPSGVGWNSLVPHTQRYSQDISSYNDPWEIGKIEYSK